MTNSRTEFADPALRHTAMARASNKIVRLSAYASMVTVPAVRDAWGPTVEGGWGTCMYMIPTVCSLHVTHTRVVGPLHVRILLVHVVRLMCYFGNKKHIIRQIPGSLQVDVRTVAVAITVTVGICAKIGIAFANLGTVEKNARTTSTNVILILAKTLDLVRIR